MITRRTATLAILAGFPLLVYFLLGSYALWHTGLLQITWWLIPLFWIGTWWLSIVWRRKPAASAMLNRPHWTPRDEAAAALVQLYQQNVDSHTPQELADPQFYLKQAQSLADKLAHHYQPQDADPWTNRTIPEIVAALRLAIDDLETTVLAAVPGSRWLTIQHWKVLGKTPRWIRHIQDTSWIAAVLINPANILRYWTSRYTIEPVAQELQSEVLATIYVSFIRQIGFYLIEMNSGRLRAGAEAYQTTFGRMPTGTRDRAGRPESGRPTIEPVTVALVGQVGAGKSSLINALTGERSCQVDILPATEHVQRIRLEVGTPPVVVTLLDTPGYGEAGLTSGQQKEIQRALKAADLILWVMDGHVPAREADRLAMQSLQQWYIEHPEQKPPRGVAVLTHVDLLPPPLEWSPPEDGGLPGGLKGQHITQAMEYVQGLFAEMVEAVIPVCTSAEPARAWGVQGRLVPVISALLSQSQATAALRAFHERLQTGEWRTTLAQVRKAGRLFIGAWWNRSA